jgi:hypothetical protein
MCMDGSRLADAWREGIFIVQGELRGARRTREAICMVINVKAVWSPNSNNLQGNKLHTISTIVQD